MVLAAITLVLALCFLACGEEKGTTQEESPAPEPLPAFTLQDANPSSETFEEAISSSDFQNQISAWYFLYTT